nr:RNA-dependent RNA polymerase [Marmot picobirnavirus]
MRYSDIAVKVDMNDIACLPNPNLKAYLSQNVAGYDVVIRSPFGKGESVDSMLSEWISILESELVEDRYTSLLQFERDKASKVGPMSVRLPLRERLDDIVNYYESVVNVDAYEPIDGNAIRSYIQEVRRLVGGMHPKSIDETVWRMKKSTNGGLPTFQKRRELIPLIKSSRLTRDAQYWDGRWYKTAAVLGWRGQEGGPNPSDVKQRVVFMFPMLVNVHELRVYQTLIEAYQKARLVPAWISNDYVDNIITKLFDTKGDDDLVITTDFTKFDQHFNAHCQAAARSILQSLFTGLDEWLDLVYPIKYDIPLLNRWGEITIGSHGMGSGSGGTNADETLVHSVLQRECAKMAGSQLNPYSMCLGDDGIISFPGCSVESVTNSYTRHGLDMNLEKQYYSTDDCVYLQRWHSKHYRVEGICAGVYATCRALGRLCYQERYYDPEYWGREAVAMRQLSIIENIKWHPLREKFADYCMKRDIYRLGLDIPGFIDQIDATWWNLNDHIQDFLSYSTMAGMSITPPSKWWITSYLKSKA